MSYTFVNVALFGADESNHRSRIIAPHRNDLSGGEAVNGVDELSRSTSLLSNDRCDRGMFGSKGVRQEHLPPRLDRILDLQADAGVLGQDARHHDISTIQA